SNYSANDNFSKQVFIVPFAHRHYLKVPDVCKLPAKPQIKVIAFLIVNMLFFHLVLFVNQL
ncbi:MAG TPA: hypothetical protein VF540_07790, partial [Segetibacter sp.]